MTYDLSSLDSRDYDRYCDDAGSHGVDSGSPEVDSGWECWRCGHWNEDGLEYCEGSSCVAFREWAANEPAGDPDELVGTTWGTEASRAAGDPDELVGTTWGTEASRAAGREVTDPDTFIVRREDNDKRFTVKRSWLIDT